MGVYLNSRKSGSVFRRTAQSLYFVDKTAILDELIPTVEQKKTAEDGQELGSGRDIRYICITRPRRFGKTVMASMIASYFGKGEPSREAFQGLEIGKSARFEEHLNRHNVIYISFNEVPDECRTYEQYISRIKKRLLGDLRTAYPDAGFTKDDAVWDALYETYMAQDIHPRNVTREGLRYWYDGYHTKAGERVYNPRSVVLALNNNNLGNYWTSSGPYDELFYYIGANVDAVKDDVGLMIADIPVPAKVREYAATSMELKTRDEIFSAMVVYGFLNYENGCVSIPNKELLDKFSDMVQKEQSLGNVYRMTRESGRMLRATKAGDTKTMEEILEFVHHTESPLQVYSNEAELASIIRWVYLQAIDYYRIEREDKAGLGYVDYIFYPYRRDDDAIIIELKVNHPAKEAILQIKDRRYALRFEGKISGKPEYTGRILAVGIAYDKNDPQKRHECKVEVLREKL